MSELERVRKIDDRKMSEKKIVKDMLEIDDKSGESAIIAIDALTVWLERLEQRIDRLEDIARRKVNRNVQS